MLREEKWVILRLSGLLGLRNEGLSIFEKLPQNLNPGFLSTIFAFRALLSDDVSGWDPVRRVMWWDDVN